MNIYFSQYCLKEASVMQMKKSVEQSVCAILLLHMLPRDAVLPGEEISKLIDASPTYFQKILRKLVNADLIRSVPGVKGGFQLNKKSEDISIYEIYLGIEGRQSLYSSSGTLGHLLQTNDGEDDCIIHDLMKEAEEAWKAVLKQETVASLSEKLKGEAFQLNIETLQTIIEEKIVV